ncbi:unnamed protein product [Symbiodinium sp. CCMP2456]|nr:unnamed protein product [Symbiodinium sp. CCMP2456]
MDGSCHGLVGGRLWRMWVLLFWQHLREFIFLVPGLARLGVSNPGLGFLDRLCIPQDDPQKIAQCVYGLASILNKSDDLIVLWYEIASFLMRRKEADRIKFVPVQISVIWILTHIAVSTTWLTLLLAQRFGHYLFQWHTLSGKINLGLVVAVQICVLYPPLFYLLNQMMSDLVQLPRVLHDFDIRTAQCFCCSNHHRHPSTGAELDCDRQLIYGVLRMWSGSRADAADVELIQAVFKGHLERHLIPSVEKRISRNGMLMRPLISAAAIGAFPFFSDFIAREVVMLFHHGWLSTYTNLCLGLYFLFYMPVFIRCLLLLGKVGSRRWRGSCCKCLVVACQALVMFLVSVVVVVGYSLSNAFSPRDVWTSPLHPMPMYLLGVMIISGTIIGLPHLFLCCRRSVMIGGTPKHCGIRSVAADMPKARKEPETKDQIFDPADIVWEESFFGI